MALHHWFGHYPEQCRSSETIGLRPKDILQLNIYFSHMWYVLFPLSIYWWWTVYHLAILSKKYFIVIVIVIETNILSSDGRIIVKHPRMLSTQSVALYNLINLNLDYQRIYTSLGLNELRPRKIMNCQSPGNFLIKLVFQIFNLKGE